MLLGNGPVKQTGEGQVRAAARIAACHAPHIGWREEGEPLPP